MARDDMMWLRHEIGQADVLVLASPLYFNGITGTAGATESTKRLLERLLPGVPASPDAPYEHAIHTTHEQVNLRKVIVLSGCGFWEIDDFYPVLTHLKAFCHNTFPELAGCIHMHRGVSARCTLPDGASEPEIESTARTAGRQVVKDYRRQPLPAEEDIKSRPVDQPGKKADTRREWSEDMLFRFTCM